LSQTHYIACCILTGAVEPGDNSVAEGDGWDQINGPAAPAPEATLVPNSPGAAFISYASQDAALADALCAALEREGVGCWIAPRDVRPGDFYADAIVQAINACSVLVVVLSRNSVDSAHVLREVERASSKRRPVITLRIDGAPLPPALEYFLSASQWIESGAEGFERLFPKLAAAVRSQMASAPKAAVEPRPANRAPPKRKPSRYLVVAAVVIALAAAYLVFQRLWLTEHVAAAQRSTASPHPANDKSIAVLPFADMSEAKDQEYFADGIAEEVLDRLAKVPGLTIVGRASSFQFKDKSADPGTVGAALGVSYLLEGSVRKEAGRVRVAAKLVEARTGAQRWSDHFESDEVDVLNVQDTIATGLARALQIAVEADTAPRASIKSPEALDAYLRGLQSLDRDTQEGAEAAVAQLQQALSLDPTFAPAAIALARAYVFIGDLGWLPPRVAFERGREAATLGQRLDPKSPLAHVMLAEIHVIYDWDWAAANRELKQAFALGPPDTYGAQVASWLAAAQGHWNEARQLALEAIALDPLNANAHGGIAFEIYLRSGNLSEAERSLRRALEIAPQYGTGHYFLGETLMLQGHLDAALAEFRKETLDDGQLEGSAMVHFAAGRKADSDASLAEAIRRNGDSWASEIARVYAFRGEKDHAFEWLERAYEGRDEDLYFMKDDPLFKNLESDPRYKAFLRKMNLPE
jgi:TolB-like protein